MSGPSLSQRKAQLDKEEREHLENVVADMRERVEDNVKFQLTQKNLDDKPEDTDALDEDTQQVVEAIELEAVDGNSWDEAFEEYVDGVGYTIVNRLAALRCMEVRDFVDEEVTVFKENGLTPAAETLVHEEFLMEDEAILEAYFNECDNLKEEIEILFDRETAYSQVDPDDDTFEELCGMLDEVPDEVWRADDVLGWVYEYYNTPRLKEVQKKAREDRLDIEDVPAANQFYTPHWVVRSLTDNSLGKLYLESTNQLDDALSNQSSLSVSDRIDRGVSTEDASNVSELCTYLAEEGERATRADFSHPSEIRVIDPACGSGHFLLYAFDILERIWWNECPEVPREEVPKKILKNNLYGVDVDLRACQIASLSLYLKARDRSEREGSQEFELPEIGIVCADAHVADSSDAVDVFSQVAGENQQLKETLEDLLTQFENIQGLGSLLKVRDSISEEFLDRQAKITESWGSARSLSAFLDELHNAISEQRDGDSFLAQDLKSFLRLLQILSQDYDVALMNPPYGAKKRMPEEVTDYVEDHYEYGPEYYINFFEVCESVLKKGGRVGMIVPRTFMFKSSFQDFREDFIGTEGTFDFLAEYGNDVLDNATVRTAGTVVRVDERTDEEPSGTFFRLHDVDTYDKEETFVRAAFESQTGDIPRKYVRPISEFDLIPGSPLSYWSSTDLRSLYDSETVFDADNGGLEQKEGLGAAKQGLSTANNSRFVRKFWEAKSEFWVPFAKGGKDAWIMPNLNLVLGWGENGDELRRFDGSYIRNEDAYFK
ncbi:BREX-5 system adenine-specific DNA-methyltransferase PglX, partial [Natrinema sp. JCM 9743]